MQNRPSPTSSCAILATTTTKASQAIISASILMTILLIEIRIRISGITNIMTFEDKHACSASFSAFSACWIIHSPMQSVSSCLRVCVPHHHLHAAVEDAVQDCALVNHQPPPDPRNGLLRNMHGVRDTAQDCALVNHQPPPDPRRWAAEYA